MDFLNYSNPVKHQKGPASNSIVNSGFVILSLIVQKLWVLDETRQC